MKHSQVFCSRNLKITGLMFECLSTPFLPHLHEHTVVGLVIAGRRQLKLGHQRLSLKAGEMLFIPPHVSHSCEDDGHEALSYLAVQLPACPLPALSPRTAELLHRLESAQAAILSNEKLKSSFLDLFADLFNINVREYFALPPAGEIAALEEAAALEYFLDALSACVVPAAETAETAEVLHNRLRELLAAPDSLLLEDLCVKSLARAFGISESTLLRRIYRELALSPQELLASLRINHCRGAILKGEKLSLAAAGSGFCDEAHLCRSFKRTEGTTPGALQKELKKSSSAENSASAAHNQD